MAKKYIVDLNKDEKAELVALTQKGRPGARKIKRANILLLDPFARCLLRSFYASASTVSD